MRLCCTVSAQYRGGAVVAEWEYNYDLGVYTKIAGPM